MKPISQGYDPNFYAMCVVTDGYLSYREDSDLTINVRFINSFSLLNLGAGSVWYSFSGLRDHGILIPNTPCQGVVFDNRRPSAGLWLRSTDVIQVRAEYWCNS